MEEESLEKHILSKSTFMRGCQCKKSLYLHKNHPDLKEGTSAAQQAIFDKGHEVGMLARELFPGGVDASPRDTFHYDESVSLTKKLLNKNVDIIYEACFQNEQVLTASDILLNEDGKWKCFEVKSSTEIKDEHILDAAMQFYIITQSGIMLDDISIVYINNQYIRKGELDLKLLFSVESIKDKVLALQDFVKEKIMELKLIISSENIPAEDIGIHCSDPYDCDFISHCWKHIKEPSVFDLTRLNSNKKFELYYKGITEFQQIPEDYKLSDAQRMQVDCFLKQKTFIEKKEIKTFLSQISYPLFYMDFETLQTPCPRFNSSKPYQQIPFQFSLHYKRNLEDDLQHHEFLAEADDNDPRIKFIESLLSVTKSSGIILTYNESFEKSILKQLASDFPQYAEAIAERISRIKDLMLPFFKRWYYSPAMNGKYSIKSVLPALIPEMSYDDLAIADGATASSAFLNLYDNTDAEEVNKVRANLKTYCQLDTFAMVKLFEHLQQL
jgi:uncharacterized protein DUF2779